jgi:hypothetical protein
MLLEQLCMFHKIDLAGTAHYTKFSFHTTKYASFRPSVLGSSFQNKFLKIITDKRIGSINLNSFAKTQKYQNGSM